MVTRVVRSADSLVLRLTSAVVSPMLFSMFTSLMADQYSSATDVVYFNFSLLDTSWVNICFRSSASCTNTVACVEMASVILMMSSSPAITFV